MIEPNLELGRQSSRVEFLDCSLVTPLEYQSAYGGALLFRQTATAISPPILTGNDLRYFALVSYGFAAGVALSESLYRFASDLMLRHLVRDRAYRALDAGCGAGRICFDLLTLYRKALVVGVDSNLALLDAAARLLATPSGAEHDLSPFGFPRTLVLPGLASERVLLVHADLTSELFRPSSFDLVVSCFVLDRMHDPEVLLTRLDGYLEPGGFLLIATPFSFATTEAWSRFPDWSALEAWFHLAGYLTIEALDSVPIIQAFDGRSSAAVWNSTIALLRKSS